MRASEHKEFCLRDAAWYEQRAQEARDASEKDPEAYYNESLKWATQVLPVLVRLSLEGDDFKMREKVYRVVSFLDDVKSAVDAWRRAVVSFADGLKRGIRVFTNSFVFKA